MGIVPYFGGQINVEMEGGQWETLNKVERFLRHWTWGQAFVVVSFTYYYQTELRFFSKKSSKI
jgi:hypothetical protein